MTFNTVVSSVMSLMNQMSKFEDKSPQGLAVVREALNAAVLIMSPITPHISAQLWERLNGSKIEDASWLTVDESALEKTTVEMVIQVNGKLRGRLVVSPGEPKDEIEAKAREVKNVHKFLQGKVIRKVINVPNLINFVVG